MAETKQDDKKKDSRGDEIDMSAHIPKGTDAAKKEAKGGIDPDDREMESKKNELGEGIHRTSATFGKVISDHETDAAGLTPEANAERTENRSDKTSKSSKSSK